MQSKKFKNVSGELAAHYRFGARTHYATALLGVLLLLVGLLFGTSGLQLLQLIPSAVLGAMLFLQRTGVGQGHRYQR